jgi:hypothetical protein
VTHKSSVTRPSTVRVGGRRRQTNHAENPNQQREAASANTPNSPGNHAPGSDMTASHILHREINEGRSLCRPATRGCLLEPIRDTLAGHARGAAVQPCPSPRPIPFDRLAWPARGGHGQSAGEVSGQPTARPREDVALRGLPQLR